MDESNLIPDRIATTLRQFPPFSMLPENAILDLAQEAKVRVLVAGEIVWAQGDPPADQLYVLVRGRVEYLITTDGQTERVAVRDEGDLLGLTRSCALAPLAPRPMWSKTPSSTVCRGEKSNAYSPTTMTPVTTSTATSS